MSQKVKIRLTDNNNFEEETINPRYVTSVEERECNTIKGSANATKIALSHSCTQTNPMVKRGLAQRTRIKKIPKEKVEDKPLAKIKAQSNL